MAEKHQKSPDDVNQVLYVIKNGPRGYKKTYLANTLTEMEEQLIECITCEGIMRDPCINEGEITCKLCNKMSTCGVDVKQVRTLVAKLRIKCPLLRDCEWTGQLSEAEEHFGTCGSALVPCPLGCEEVVRRSQSNEHTNNKCLFREVRCIFCAKIFQFIDLRDHADVCPDQPIKCECGIEIPRSKMEVHIDTEVECPYAKYSCNIGKIHRKDLLAHKKEFYIEHQDMLERENCKLREAMWTKKDLTETQVSINLKDTDINNLKEENVFIHGNSILRCELLSVDPIEIIIPNNAYVRPFDLVLGIRRTNRVINECRLILDRTNKMKGSYFEVINLNSRGEGEKVIKLEKEIYSRYIKEDGTLLIRLFFDIYPQYCSF